MCLSTRCGLTARHGAAAATTDESRLAQALQAIITLVRPLDAALPLDALQLRTMTLELRSKIMTVAGTALYPHVSAQENPQRAPAVPREPPQPTSSSMSS